MFASDVGSAPRRATPVPRLPPFPGTTSTTGGVRRIAVPFASSHKDPKKNAAYLAATGGGPAAAAAPAAQQGAGATQYAGGESPGLYSGGTLTNTGTNLTTGLEGFIDQYKNKLENLEPVDTTQRKSMLMGDIAAQEAGALSRAEEEAEERGLGTGAGTVGGQLEEGIRGAYGARQTRGLTEMEAEAAEAQRAERERRENALAGLVTTQAGMQQQMGQFGATHGLSQWEALENAAIRRKQLEMERQRQEQQAQLANIGAYNALLGMA